MGTTLTLKIIWEALKRGFKSFLDFYIQYWKITVPVTIVILGYIAFSVTYNNGVSAGVEKERLVWEERIKAEEIRNQELSDKLNGLIQDFGATFEEEESERIIQESLILRQLEDQLNDSNLENCKIDQDILNSINELKNAGEF